MTAVARARGRPVSQLPGRRFGRLVVLERVGNMGRRSRWACRCDCGAEIAETQPLAETA